MGVDQSGTRVRRVVLIVAGTIVVPRTSAANLSRSAGAAGYSRARALLGWYIGMPYPHMSCADIGAAEGQVADTACERLLTRMSMMVADKMLTAGKCASADGALQSWHWSVT